MSRTFYVTATDTDAGKTFVSTVLLRAAKKQGLRTIALKPLASGCEKTDSGLRNEDALKLMAEITEDLPYEMVNPVTFEPAIAPHIAALKAEKAISLDRLAGYCRGALMKKADFKLVEGAGGWRVPLNPSEMLSGLPKMLGTDAILVVPLKLGCLNQAMLTAEAMLRDGINLAGWIGNHPTSAIMAEEEENIKTLNSIMPGPCLGILPWLADGNLDTAVQFLNQEEIQKSLFAAK